MNFSFDCEPVSLVDYGLSNYLNNIIQCISSCPLFVRRLDKIYSGNVELSGISTIMQLIKIFTQPEVDNNDFLENCHFIEWNHTELRTSYDLLMCMMNDAYNEKRVNQGNPEINQWLKERLPLRVVFKLEYYCECGYQTCASPQSEFSINISVLGRSSKDLQLFIDNYFADSTIDGRVCDTENCKRETGAYRRKLSLPLPETLCIHVERITDIRGVNVSGELIIKSDFCENKPNRDISYFLKSAIITGDRGCYKKIKDCWYIVANNRRKLVSESDVLSCKADVLFYELSWANDNLSEMPVPLVDYCLSDDLHCVIQSLSSCKNLGKLIKGSNKGAESLPRLMNMANGCDKVNESMDTEVINRLNERSHLDVCEVVKDLLKEILEKVGSTENESPGESENIPPWIFTTSHLLECYCGSKFLSNTKTNIFLDIPIPEDQSVEVQALFDEYFGEVESEQKCTKIQCPTNNTNKRILVHHPLPTLLCVQLRKGSNSIVQLSEEVRFWGQYSTISERGNRKSFTAEFMLFHLRSVIVSDGCKSLRKMGDHWFVVEDTSSEDMELDEVLACNPDVLFYESEPLEDEDEEVSDSDEEDKRNEVKGGDVSDGPGTCLNRIIQSLASCSKFVDWVNNVSDNANLAMAQTLCSLVNMANNTLKADRDVDKGVLKEWSDRQGSTVYETMKMVLEGVMNESSGCKDEHPIVMYNISSTPISYPGTELFIDLQIPESLTGKEPLPLRSIVDNHFEIWQGYGELHLKSLKSDVKPIKVAEALPDTLGLIFEEGDHGVVPALEIVVKNVSCSGSVSCHSRDVSCCRRYVLRSMITKDGYGYKIGTGRFYRITESEYVSVDEDEVLCQHTAILMYQWQQ